MTFQTIDLNSLPKREPRGYDEEAADALLAAVQSAPDTGASDGKAYKDETEARKLAAKHKRLLAHKAPAGTAAKSRVFAHPDGKGWAWAVFLGTPPKSKSK